MSQIKKTKSIQPWEDLGQGHWVEQLYRNFDAGTCLLRTRSIKKASGARTQGTGKGKAGWRDWALVAWLLSEERDVCY